MFDGFKADRGLQSHDDVVTSLSVASGKLLSTSLDTTALLHDLGDATPVKTFTHTSGVLSGGLFSQTPVAVTGSEGSKLTYWSTDTSEIVAESDRFPAPITCMCLVLDCIFVGGHTDAYAVSAATGTVIREYVGHTGSVRCLLFCDGMLFTGASDSLMKGWDPTSATMIRNFAGHKAPITALSGKDDLIISGSEDRTVRMWSASLGTCLRVLCQHHEDITQVFTTQTISPTRPYLYSSSLDYTVRCWSLHTLRSVVRLRGVATAMTVSGSDLYVGMQLGNVERWDTVVQEENLASGGGDDNLDRMLRQMAMGFVAVCVISAVFVWSTKSQIHVQTTETVAIGEQQPSSVYGPPKVSSCASNMLPFYILQLNTSEQEVATALRRVHPLPSYCHMLGPMDGYCMELSLHAAMRSHPCRVDNLKNASMVWLETYFIAHKIARNYSGLGSTHSSAWLNLLGTSLHARKNPYMYFMYYPSWKRPTAHLINKKNFRKWPNPMMSKVNVVAHNVGLNAEMITVCHRRCLSGALGSTTRFHKCLRLWCPKMTQTIIVVPDFLNRTARHISIPYYEPKCATIVFPEKNAERPIRLLMMGRWPLHISRIRIRRSFENYWRSIKKPGPLGPHANLHDAGSVKWGNSSVVLSDMRRAVFCIETQGDSLNTRRLTDAVLCGCIPVIACNDCVYPYAHLLKGFTVRIPDRDISDIVATVMAIDNATIARLQDGVRAVRNMFASPDCGREKSTMADQVVREMALRVWGLLDGTITTDYDRAPLN